METSLTEIESPPGQTFTGETDNTTDKSNKQRWKLQNGAIRMAGFLFWANIVALFSLTIGCFAPGWLTVDNNDYSLWHITKCDTISLNDREIYRIDKLRPCETLSYRLIEAMPVGTDIHTALGYMDFAQAEVLYCVGMILSFVTLCGWYKFRRNVARDKCVDLIIRKWVFLFILAALSAVLIFVPVGMFSRERSSFVSFFSGIVFAGFGGAIMALVAASILLHLLCLPFPSCDICLYTSSDEPLVQASTNI
ncbi:uncharacterized protein LOC128546932 [Mercenaria mercenaria]|uniref:uncharacterized protein LOC128546932 n=1 Tax=Mercenaria mercenaria TaxID=6596 RepID=UPI00234FA708|nr:uncharacterized protein LOC128546932 [Mercenaria mercenaria]